MNALTTIPLISYPFLIVPKKRIFTPLFQCRVLTLLELTLDIEIIDEKTNEELDLLRWMLRVFEECLLRHSLKILSHATWIPPDSVTPSIIQLCLFRAGSFRNLNICPESVSA